MEVKLIKALVGLGVPGVALGIFYLLLKGLGFKFATIGPSWAAVIALVFLLIVGAITFYALNRWAPRDAAREPKVKALTVGTPVVITSVPQRSLEKSEGIVEWKSGMDKFCGREAKVTEISRKGASAIKLDVDSGQYWWAAEWLTPARFSAAKP